MAFVFTDQNVNELIASGQPVVIDFWATWCGPCMRMSPVIDELAAEFEGKVLVGKYNIEDETEFSTANSIMSITN
ncbi:MAG: redoxin domain-containing protein, partial [Duncaniella sp.]|nr:redoxin domain-containing protein [Duncaniella sp.]